MLNNSAAQQLGISIHAAREGGDVLNDLHFFAVVYFNPRRP